MRKQRVVDDRDEPPHEKEARKQSKRPSVAAGFTVRRSGDRGCVGNWGQAAHPLSNLICMSIYPVSIGQYSDCVRSMRTRSEEHTSELQSLMRTSYAVFCLQKKTHETNTCIYYTQYQV